MPAVAHAFTSTRERRLERETGIEPATNSLEGCDSTTELLPPSRRSLRLSPLRRASPLAARRAIPPSLRPTARVHLHRHRGARVARLPPRQTEEGRPSPPTFFARSRAPTFARANRARKGWWGGEGSNLRSPKAAGLQPAAIDRSATSPKYITRAARSGHDRSGPQRLQSSETVGHGPQACTCHGVRVSDVSLKGGVTVMELAEGFEPPTC